MPLNRRSGKLSGKGTTALIDGDVLVYACGFASDQNHYVCEDGVDFKYKKEAVEYSTEKGYDVKEIKKHITTEPVENCLHSVRQMIDSVINATKAGIVKVYLTGKGNFREELPSETIYKGNREDAPKPTHYKAIRDYLTDTWNAEVTEGQEADDALGIYQSNNKDTVICTVDKDLDMISGKHYNWTKPSDGVYSIGKFEGLQNFYQQILKGDNVDNIKAIYGVGKAKAKKMLEHCSTEQEMCIETQLCYAEYGLSPEQYLTNARLLWIRTKEDELWTPSMEMRTEWLNSYMGEL